ncbi:hypothetical protein CI102_4320 [Trichoderma harzianum]|uniref:Uncharacterized protein n=1 Tax=Trichoderma harzianum CBS 226.95 TaxID=983964 RepID=A0A2T4ASY5_TRIHA|nr:hypothetical protein M431DRAFT_173060 [Trichoderma harzianum CBS 226.95]PKK50220.1 hypothetical protein CI102_4320 [Trichoderma harzianum]PTB60163.1 hypothetical protein M431DRAFT_173060 [Trichoderma harzianum CBS 226.95]
MSNWRRLLEIKIASFTYSIFIISQQQYPYHRHNPSLSRSTVYHQNQSRHSATLPSASQSGGPAHRPTLAVLRLDFPNVSDFPREGWRRGEGNGSGSLKAWLQHVQASDMYNDTSRETEETLWKPALSGRCNG